MRITIRLPDDLLQQVALDALKRRRNSKEVVITEILRTHYGGKAFPTGDRPALQWRIPAEAGRRIAALRRRTKDAWA